MTLRELKKTATDKLSQGDVNIYALPKNPELTGDVVTDPVLVYGASGNHHKLTGGSWTAIKIKTGQFVLNITKSTSFTHEQHKPPHKLGPGFYLVDRAREKGMFDDMVGPVSD